jgi:hypothetical protein
VARHDYIGAALLREGPAVANKSSCPVFVTCELAALFAL